MILKGICCVCGIVYREGETINGKASHGLCPQCFDVEMEKIRSDDNRPALHPICTQPALSN
jgi:NMD protein affecting ribosome stability and mRNA decay